MILLPVQPDDTLGFTQLNLDRDTALPNLKRPTKLLRTHPIPKSQYTGLAYESFYLVSFRYLSAVDLSGKL